MRLDLLGGFALWTPAEEAVHVPRKKAQALLAYLANPAGRSHPRDKLSALLWPETRDAEARRNLRQVLFTLRQCLGVARAGLSIDEDAVSLEATALDVDVARFERLVAEKTPAMLEEGCRLYRGEFLAGLAVAEPPFEEWLVTERERIRELALEAVARLLAHQSRAGALAEATQTALRLVALDPLQEAAHRALMTLYARQGRREAALRQYQVCVGVLRDELGTEPESGTRELYRSLLRAHRTPPRSGRGATATPPRAGATLGWSAEPDAGETALVGREGQLAQLRVWLQDARGGRGRAVAVIGESGIGKSRLLREVAGDTMRDGGAALLGRASLAQQTLPFGPWIDALRLGGVLKDARVRQRLDRRRRLELARLFPELGEHRASVDAEQRVRLFDAIEHLLTLACERVPVTLILEDLHWADEMSLRLASYVARRAPARRLLIAMSARPEEMAESPMLRDLFQEESVSRIALEPLSREATMTLVQTLDRKRRGGTAMVRLAQQVWDASAGHPFMVLETMRALEEGAAAGESTVLSLSARIREVVLARLDRLSERGRALAAVASVIGRDFSFELLESAATLGSRDVVEGLEELVRRRVLRLAVDHFDFVHDWMRHVAYAELLPPRRSMLHRQVAEAIEALHGDDLEAHAAALGRHYEQGELWEKAVTHLHRAAVRAMSQSALHEATVCYQRALHALDHLPRTPERIAEGIDLRLGLRGATVVVGDWESPHEAAMRETALCEAETLAEMIPDRRRLVKVLLTRSYHHFTRAEYAQSLEVARRAVVLAGEEGDPALERDGRIRLGWTSFFLGEYRDALEELTRASRLGGDDRSRGADGALLASSQLAYWLVRCLAEVGRFDEAAAHAERALAIAEEMRHDYSVASVLLSRGFAEILRGEARLAIDTLERAMALCVEGELALLMPTVLGYLGSAYVLAGRIDDGLRALRESVAAARPWLTRSVVDLGAACLASGDLTEAGRLASCAVATARRLGERGTLAWGLRLAGEIAARSDPRDAPAAERFYGEALGLADELGMRPLVARCRLGLGALGARTGMSLAREHLADAAAPRGR